MVYKIYKCLKCQHIWPSKRKKQDVNICPKCKSATWHKPKEIKKYDKSSNQNQSGSNRENIEMAQENPN